MQVDHVCAKLLQLSGRGQGIVDECARSTVPQHFSANHNRLSGGEAMGLQPFHEVARIKISFDSCTVPMQTHGGTLGARSEQQTQRPEQNGFSRSSFPREHMKTPLKLQFNMRNQRVIVDFQPP